MQRRPEPAPSDSGKIEYKHESESGCATCLSGAGEASTVDSGAVEDRAIEYIHAVLKTSQHYDLQHDRIHVFLVRGTGRNTLYT